MSESSEEKNGVAGGEDPKPEHAAEKPEKEESSEAEAAAPDPIAEAKAEAQRMKEQWIRTAADFDTIPYMALKGDYTASSTVCEDTVKALNARRAAKQGTAKAEYLKLDDMGILGVTHMMMLDKKNLEIADIMLNWVNKNVQKKR